MTRATVAKMIAQDIADERTRAGKKPFIPQYKKTKAICLICGMILDPITNVHAKLHNYANKRDFIADGKVKYIG